MFQELLFGLFWPLLLLAGVGAGMLIDRLAPPRPRQAALHAPPPVPEARKRLEFDDTMDVLADGIDVGRRMERASSRPPWQMIEPGPGLYQPPPELAEDEADPYQQPDFLPAPPERSHEVPPELIRPNGNMPSPGGSA